MVNDQPNIPLNQPTLYQIHIQGTLDESWGDYFDGQTISAVDGSVTILRTPPMDQPALVGLVNRLNGLGLRILSVEQVSTEENLKEETKL